MAKSNFENLAVYQLAERLADDVWEIVVKCPLLPCDTVGKKLIRAADSIGANIAEGDGRGTYQENRRFTRIARDSLNETKHWLRRAFKRKFLSKSEISRIKSVLDEFAPPLSAHLKLIGPKTPDHCQLPTDH
jgi:four helix bundle protein